MTRIFAFLIALGLLSTPSYSAYNGIEIHAFKNISATTSTFTLRGGNYAVTAHATWNSGTLALQRQAADAATMVTAMTAFSADGYATANLPSGTYQFTVTGSPSGIYVDITSVVTVQ